MASKLADLQAQKRRLLRELGQARGDADLEMQTMLAATDSEVEKKHRAAWMDARMRQRKINGEIEACIKQILETKGEHRGE